MQSPPQNPVLDAVPRNLMVELEELEEGIVVSPGTAFGAGEGYVRVSLVPIEGECREAVERWERVT